MKCEKCKEEIEISYCKKCYGEVYYDNISRIMKGDPNHQMMMEILNVRYILDEKTKDIQKNIDEINNAFKDFKIRGFKLKSIHKRENE